MADKPPLPPLTPAAIVLTPADDGAAPAFTAPANWLQGRSAFGGLQAAWALVALRTVVSAELPLRVLQATFVGPVPEGTVHAQARVLRTGRNVTHAEARLLNSTGETLATFTALFGPLRDSRVVVPMPPREELPGPGGRPDFPQVPGMTPVFFRHFHVRWAAGGTPYSGAKKGDTRIWLKLAEADALPDTPAGRELALALLADAVPPAALSLLSTPTMVSTMTWMLEVLAPLPSTVQDAPGTGPDEGFWRMDTDLDAASGGHAVQTGRLYAPDGTPVAWVRQSVAVFG